MMRRLIATALALAASAALAATTTTTESAPAEFQPPASAFETVSVPIPNQTVSGWYTRGNPDSEAADLETFLRTLVWGNASAQATAQAEGRSIEVDLSAAAVAVTDTQPNIERIMDTVDPGLDALPRRQILSQGQDTRRVSSGISSLPADAGSGLISRRPRVATSSTGTGSSSASATARRTLRQDDEMAFHGLRITLVDVFEATAGSTTGSTGSIGTETRTTAVLMLETQNGSTELEVQVRRSVNFENFRIRVIDAEGGSDRHVTLEVTDMDAQ
jgi:hypothetical protein